MSVSGQSGNMVPLTGDVEIRQQSTAADILNIVMATGASTAAGIGAALDVRRGGSSLSDHIFRAEYDGTWGMRKVISLSTASSAVTMAASESGAFVIIGNSTAKEMQITLPAVEAGLWYEFYQAGGICASVTTIASATVGLIVAGKDTAANSVSIGVATGTGLGGSLRFISDGTNWFCVMQPGVSSGAISTGNASLPNIVT